jgi:hypothetical protein
MMGHPTFEKCISDLKQNIMKENQKNAKKEKHFLRKFSAPKREGLIKELNALTGKKWNIKLYDYGEVEIYNENNKFNYTKDELHGMTAERCHFEILKNIVRSVNK